MRSDFLIGAMVLSVLECFVAPSVGADESRVLDIGNRRELFVDYYLIDRLQGAELRLHNPRPANVVLRSDRPWDGMFAFSYATVIKDDDLYRMYYRCALEAGRDGSAAEVTCYAESNDGINWTKPELNIYEVLGTKKNNVVLANAPPFSHNFAPFVDPRPGVPASERYKAIAGISRSGLFAFASADGIHWRKTRDEPVYTDKGWVFDSQNVAFWSETEECYVLYYRKAPKKVRSVARTTSKDFVNWSEPVMMSFGDTSAEHIYTNQTHPYFRAPHIYIAVAARFFPGRKVLTDEQAGALGLPPHPSYPRNLRWLTGDCSEAVFMTSRGGNQYDRIFLEGFVRPGLGLRNWTSRSNYPARGVVPTGPSEMSLYVQRHYGQKSVHLQRMTLRTDGFVSVHAPYKDGEMVTKPFKFKGKELEINFSTSAVGSIRVEIQDEKGMPLPGYRLDDCSQIIGDQIERVVAWKGGSDVSNLAGKTVRLRFVMKDADLYSLRFRR